jgi:serine/threonine-protein kinase HipA
MSAATTVRRLLVHVQNQAVATLETTDGFEHALTYHPEASDEQFVSLLMPVRSHSYLYPELHPLFRMNLPEGFLLSVLQEQLGPHVGASPLNLLSVVGRNGVGRVKLAAPGADPRQPPAPFELSEVLRGDNAEENFVRLVRRFAVSGVSGVVPKFLSPPQLPVFHKASLTGDTFIVKGSTRRLPGAAINEHLCLQVAHRAGMPAARTQVSDDGHALIVQRFDLEAEAGERKGMEDLCSLLLLRPEQKYESTWERVVARIKDVVPSAQQQGEILSALADQLLLSYAVRNADLHTKNIALLYSDRQAVTLAPAFDVLCTSVYPDFSSSPPALSLEGRSSWRAGKALGKFLQVRLGIYPAQARVRIERICQAIVELSPELVGYGRRYPWFQQTAQLMLQAWNEGMNSLRTEKS